MSPEKSKSSRVSDLSSSFDPLEWAEKRKLAMAKASELREQRRTKAADKSNSSLEHSSPRVVRAESRDSISTQGEGPNWKWVNSVPPPKSIDKPSESSHAPPRPRTRELTKPPVPRTSARRAVTSPVEKRVVKKTLTVDPRPRIPATRQPFPVTGKATVRSTVFKRPVPPPSSARVPLRPSATPRPSGPENEPSDASDPVTRQMIDRDTLRLENRDMFVRAISYWRSKNVNSLQDIHSGPSKSSVAVYVRKRPLFDREAVAKEYDVLTVVDHSTIVTHNCLFQADLKTPYVVHSKFRFNKCFDENTQNIDVYDAAARDLVSLASGGGLATLCCFGQTGSGKTHTMTAMEKSAAFDLFKHHRSVDIEFIELCGKKVLDLLSDSDFEKQQVKLREGPDGNLVIDGVSTHRAESPGSLSQLMEAAHARRNTESTGANDVSSRSHAVCIIHTGQTGKLMLVDLAGSERRKDSMWHDKDRQREGAQINASLHALKECIRWRASGGYAAQALAPFRLSTLTRVLAETFANPEARLGVIATVSPCATDIEHTVSTLKSVSLLVGGQAGVPPVETKQTEMFPKDHSVTKQVHPKKWSPDQVQAWLEKEGEKNYFLPKSTTGAMLVRMPESRFIQVCNGDDRRGAKLYRSLHDLMTTNV